LESPGEVLAWVNDAVVADILPSTFVTCFYGILDPGSSRLSYANAGHNLPCCRREDAATELCTEAALFPRTAPIGLINGEKLLELLMDHKIGVRERAPKLHELDESNFEALTEDELGEDVLAPRE
jgi:serine phosphatase RsbU (regulator of sigma subunit)